MDNKVRLLGFQLVSGTTKDGLTEAVTYAKKTYKKTYGRDALHVIMNTYTSVKIKDILGIVDNILVKICDLIPIYDDSTRDDMIFVGERAR